MIRKHLLLILFSLFFINLRAQLIPKDYYSFPINPGQPAYLSGTMGELRSNHFHAGLDIKTGGVEGLPVYASADGYVSRAKFSAYGYGNVIYIQHPNGQSTTYAHLQSFRDDLQKKMIEEQYKNESFEMEIFPDKNEFLVKKGEIIGRSGNSGGSGGPHLHWEIRDNYSRPINPLLGNFSEIKDNITPVVYKLGLQTLSANAHVNNEFGFFSLTPSKTGTNSYTYQDIYANGTIGISLNANDKLNGTANNNGVAGIEVLVNGKSSYKYYNDKFSFSDSKMINHHIEFERYQDGYGHFHRCYVADGNSLDFYKSDDNHGLLNIADTGSYKIKIITWDAYNNESSLEFTIKGLKLSPAFTQTLSTSTAVKTKLYENILKVSVSNNGKDLKYYRFGQAYSKSPLYIKNNEAIYTFDLRKEFPDSIIKGNIHHQFNFSHLIVPNKEFTAYNKNSIVRFSKGDIKDTLYLEYKELNDVFTIGDAYTPVYRNIMYILKPVNNYPNKEKTSVYYYNGSYNSFIGGTWMGNNLEFSTNKLGTFKILEDTKEPYIQLVTRNSKYIRVKISDNLSGIKSYRATLDGNYLLMSYRYQTGVLESIRADENIPLKGLFKIVVEDMVGNTKEYSLQL